MKINQGMEIQGTVVVTTSENNEGWNKEVDEHYDIDEKEADEQ